MLSGSLANISPKQVHVTLAPLVPGVLTLLLVTICACYFPTRAFIIYSQVLLRIAVLPHLLWGWVLVMSVVLFPVAQPVCGVCRRQPPHSVVPHSAPPLRHPATAPPPWGGTVSISAPSVPSTIPPPLQSAGRLGCLSVGCWD